MNSKLLFVGMMLPVFTGCASIVSGTNQPVSVETRVKGESVVGASCTMINDKGKWFVTTPGSATIQRSFNDLSVNCEKVGASPGIAMVKSSTKPMAFGNILFGGVIGAGVDVATGAAYDYPPLIVIEMGTSAVIAPPPSEPAVKTGEAR